MFGKIFKEIYCYISRDLEGRSINKLQNIVILLFFQISKIRNIRFVGNLILSSSCEFYYNDITVTSFISIKYGDVPTKSSHNEKGAAVVVCGQIRFILRCILYMATVFYEANNTLLV